MPIPALAYDRKKILCIYILFKRRLENVFYPIGSRIYYVQPKCDDDFIKTSGYLIDPISGDKCANSILCN
jgi:hypothetical protein